MPAIQRVPTRIATPRRSGLQFHQKRQARNVPAMSSTSTWSVNEMPSSGSQRLRANRTATSRASDSECRDLLSRACQLR